MAAMAQMQPETEMAAAVAEQRLALATEAMVEMAQMALL
jgi:hypothetical protein